MTQSRILVMKFGGTSLATAHTRHAAADLVLRAVEEEYDVVVVVSAMGRRGDPYATDSLLDLLRQTGGAVDPRDYDAIFACGEMISSVVFNHELRNHGVPGIALTGGQAGIITDGIHEAAEIVEVLPSFVKKHLASGLVPVVAGCQGAAQGHDEVVTLGRGGSDTSAVALGGALQAVRVEIYTDVPGVAKADPRCVRQPEFLESIDYESMLELSRYGAKVVHQRAVKMAAASDVSLLVLSTFEPARGTRVSGDVPPSGVTAITTMDCIGATLPDDNVLASREFADVRRQHDLMELRGINDRPIVGVNEADLRACAALQHSLRDLQLEKHCWLSLIGQPETLHKMVGSVRRTLGALGRKVDAQELNGRRLTFIVRDARGCDLAQPIYDELAASSWGRDSA